MQQIEELIKIYGKVPTDANRRRIMGLIKQEKVNVAKRIRKTAHDLEDYYVVISPITVDNIIEELENA